MPQTNSIYSSNERMTSRAGLNNLLERLTKLLPDLPGFRKLSLFGSLTDGKSDAYSDIDIILTTDDLPASKAHLLGLVEEIGQIEFCWVLPLRPDEWNPTIVFCDEGYYHRLEIGLTDINATNRTIPEEQTTLLVDSMKPKREISLRESHAYAPPHESIGHFLLGIFIGGALRYAKSRKRSQAMTCYRFAHATYEWCQCAHYAALTGWHSLKDKLSTDEYKAYDARLNEEEKMQILSLADFSTLKKMDVEIHAILSRLLSHCEEIAKAKGEILQRIVFERMLNFLTVELGLENS